MNFVSNRVSKFLIHLLFWALFIFVSLFFFTNYHWTSNPFLQYLIILVSIVYINDFIFLPFFVRKKWYFLYILIIALISFAATQLYCNVFAECGCSIAKCLADYLWQTIVPIIFFSFVWMLFRYLEKQEEIDAVKKKHTEMELKFLKSQINPHVLFNNLNTIYSYALEKPDEVPNMILMLSDNLKHVLYESNTERVSLEKEITFIDNYIAFQEIRTQDVKTIQYQKNIDSLDYQIAPLLLITIIENAFKHSTMESTVFIEINVKEGVLECLCKNAYSEIEVEQIADDHIGLTNLKKRLDLIYNDSYTLSIEKQQEFTVVLTLKLNA